MKLNFTVEPYVREALAAAVGQEPERYDRALFTIAEKGDAAIVEAINLGLAIAGFALADLHEGKRPSPRQINNLANDLIESEAWAEIDKTDAVTVLTALTNGQPVDLSPADTADIIFAMDAWLLSAFGPEERKWNQYLDQILAMLESVSE